MNKKTTLSDNSQINTPIDLASAEALINGKNGKYIVIGASILLCVSIVSVTGISAYAIHNGYDVDMSFSPLKSVMKKVA